MNLSISKHKIVAVTAFGVLILGSFYKWAIFSRMGIVPKNICSPQVMRNYLKQGGNPNAWRSDFDYSFPIVKCFAKFENPSLLDLFTSKGGDIYKNYWGDNVWKEARSPESALMLFKYLENDDNISDQKKQDIILQLLSKSKSTTLLLLENGANIDIYDSQKNTILHKTRDPELVIFVVNKGININFQNQQGKTPLHLSISEVLTKVLIELGAKINVKDNDGNTPLHTIISSRIYYERIKEIVKLLIDSEANVNERNSKGQTPLHLVEHKSIAKVLIESGAEINIKDNEGKTPIEDAKIKKKLE
ncbi:MAG: ankyrin repeat domain-containing protein [Cyanobacteria bacterium J06621_8]